MKIWKLQTSKHYKQYANTTTSKELMDDMAMLSNLIAGLACNFDITKK